MVSVPFRLLIGLSEVFEVVLIYLIIVHVVLNGLLVTFDIGFFFLVKLTAAFLLLFTAIHIFYYL